jgi:hypothetical protein
MINKIEQLQNFQDSVESRDALDRLRALQYMQAQSQGLMGLPVVQRSVGGGAGAGGAGGGGAAANPGFIPRQPAYGGRGLPSAPIRQNIPQEVIQQPEENVVNIPIAAQGNLELNTASITPTEITPQMMAAPEAPIEAIGPTGQELPQPTGLASVGRSGFIRPAAHGGPIVHRFSGGIGKVFPNLHEKVSLGDKGIISGGIGDVIRQAQAAGFFPSQAQTQAQVLPTPQVVPEVGPQVQEAPSLSTLADVNADALSRHGEGSTFKYGDQHYEATSGGPLAIHTLTEEGMRNRAIRGGLMDWDQRANTGIDYAPDRHTLSEADMFRTPRGYGPSPDLFNRPVMPEGFVPPPEVPGIQPTFEALEGQPINPPTAITRSELPGYGTELNWTDPYGNATMAPTHEDSYAIENIQPERPSDFIDMPRTVTDYSEPFIGKKHSGKGFISKEAAMEHQRQNEGGGLRTQVYQLPDGSWDYQRVDRGPTPIGLPVTPGGPAIGASPSVAGLVTMRRNPVTGDYERYSDPNLALAGGGHIAEAAQGLESLGRKGDNILVHMNPEELQGLASLGEITYNPITGLPEAFSLKKIFRGIRKLAPVALTIAAPFLLGPAGLGVFSSGFLGSAVGTGLASGMGSFLGNIIAGAKPKDALKAGLMSGVTAGGMAKLGGAPWSGSAKGITPPPPPTRSGTLLKTVTGPSGAPSYGGQLTTPASQFSMADVGRAQALGIDPKIALAQDTQLANLRAQAVAAQPKAYGVTPQIQAGQQMTAPQLQAVVDPSSQAQWQGPPEQPRTLVKGDINYQQQPDMIERVGQSPLVQDTTGSLKQIGKDIWKDYGNLGGAAKVVGMDLMTPDWEAQYAAEAAAKNKQLEAAGYTVDTGFDGQTVIRDSSGVVMPRNLTVQQILDRALGKTPRTRLVERYDYAPATAKQGGLISLAGGGEFSGRVEGRGHGMEDNVFMPIKEKGEQIGTLAVSPAEYVVDAHTMSALGNGNANEGAKVMDGVVASVRKKAYGTIRQPREIDGLQTLKPLMERV